MTESEWAELRQRLCSQFPEDTVQTVLLRLWEFLASGQVLETEPIFWCRTVAYRAKLNQIRDDKNEQLALPCVKANWPSSTSPEQEAIFLEDEVYNRLGKPLNRFGKPLSRHAAEQRRYLAKKKKRAAV